jgi:hypothetical protein
VCRHLENLVSSEQKSNSLLQILSCRRSMLIVSSVWPRFPRCAQKRKGEIEIDILQCCLHVCLEMEVLGHCILRVITSSCFCLKYHIFHKLRYVWHRSISLFCILLHFFLFSTPNFLIQIRYHISIAFLLSHFFKLFRYIAIDSFC